MEEEIKKASRILKDGGIIIFPTDTAFGIGCRIDNKNAVERLLLLRKRPMGKAIPILVDSIETARKYLENLESEVEELMKKYWPGALTIIYNCKTDKISPRLRANGKTLGVRVPDHSVILKLINQLGVPVLGPSANFAGNKTPYRFEDLDSELVNLVDFVLQGETSGVNKPSTVIDCTKKPWKILRQGAIKINIKN